ncbi:MAG: UDP-N-acetylmuramoyl-tripeptide--D-alanyl-D-alanine ligase [Atopobiaceae bacterium]|nr:UDP-N-acetylmuramoyl-tripeptide--D-alanyl-D-alanine ligase [Atopobiaceae bacterium]
MFESDVQRLIDATGAALVCGEPTQSFCGFAIDSRQVEPGCAFVAFVGENVDGNNYVDAALDAGAALCIMSAEASPEMLSHAQALGAAIVRAADDDCEELLLRLAADWRKRNPQWRVVGVTGSVGKTTTKDMLAAAAHTQWKTHATKGNFNSVIGAPLTILDAKPTDELLVLEMGMNHAGELDRISRAAQPDVALITNIGSSHVGLLGSRENIARAKAEIMVGMRPAEQSGVSAQLVLSSADDFTSFIEDELAAPRGISVIRVGQAPTDDVRLGSIELDEEGLAHFSLTSSHGNFEGCCPVRGRAAVLDCALALAAIDALGGDIARAFEAVQDMPATHMRLELVSASNGMRIIDDSYNASPASMASALDVLSSMKHEGRKIAVLGEMGELGDDEKQLHALVGAYTAAKPLDLLVIVGTQAACDMEQAAKLMGMESSRIVRVDSVEAASEFLADQLSATDLMLVKASRAVGLDRLVREVLSRVW